MGNYINYSLSVEKGLIGNIGAMTILKNKSGQPYMNMMLFLSANSEGNLNGVNKDGPAQIINVHFPEGLFELLKQYSRGDLVRIHFDRIDLSRCMDGDTFSDVLFIRAKANNIELLRKVSEKKKAVFEHQAPIMRAV